MEKLPIEVTYPNVACLTEKFYDNELASYYYEYYCWSFKALGYDVTI